MKEKFERLNKYPRLKQEIIFKLFDYLSNKANNRWWSYKGEFIYEDITYDLEVECQIDTLHTSPLFKYRNFFISHKQVVLDIDDVLSMELSEIARIKKQ